MKRFTEKVKSVKFRPKRPISQFWAKQGYLSEHVLHSFKCLLNPNIKPVEKRYRYTDKRMYRKTDGKTNNRTEG